MGMHIIGTFGLLLDSGQITRLKTHILLGVRPVIKLKENIMVQYDGEKVNGKILWKII